MRRVCLIAVLFVLSVGVTWGQKDKGGPKNKVSLPECAVDGQVTKWSDAEQNWVCASDDDTLGTLVCTNGQVAEFNGMVWECVAGQGVRVPTCSDGQILKWNANSAVWDCADMPTVGPTLVMVDSQGQEIGVVVDEKGFYEQATVATELAGNTVLLTVTRFELRGRGQPDIGNGGVVFTDSTCQTAWRPVNPPGDRFIAPLSVVEAPGLTVYVAQPGTVVNQTPTHLFNSFGQCVPGGFPEGTYLPATAIANLAGVFFPPFSLGIR